VLTMPILVGTDGTEKMSKSLGNYVGVTDAPEEMFGRTMSIPDAAMPEWLRLASGLGHDEREDVIVRLERGDLKPNEAKRLLARSVVARFHGAEAGVAAEQHFDTVFRSKAVPDDVPQLALAEIARNDEGRVFLPALLQAHLGVASGGEARRLLQQGGVRIDGDPIPTGTLELDPSELAGRVLQVGKRRFLRIVEG
jgi:tyrosyl-tRNA synthetase